VAEFLNGSFTHCEKRSEGKEEGNGKDPGRRGRGSQWRVSVPLRAPVVAFSSPPLRRLSAAREPRRSLGYWRGQERRKEGRDDLGRPPPADALGACRVRRLP